MTEKEKTGMFQVWMGKELLAEFDKKCKEFNKRA